jgi:hypothetical protein
LGEPGATIGRSEAEFLPVAGETKIIRVDFVERDGTVADHRDFIVNLTAPQRPTSSLLDSPSLL